jgi:hypothetical protein
MKITKSKLREIINEELDAVLQEEDPAGCADRPKGCIRQRGGKWVILNNKKGGIWNDDCKSHKNCAAILTAFHASGAMKEAICEDYDDGGFHEFMEGMVAKLQEGYPEDPGADQRDDDERMLHSLEKALEDAEDDEDAEKIAAEIADLKKGPYGGHNTYEELMDAVADLFKEEETPGMSDMKDLVGEDTLEEAEMSGDLSGVPAEALAALMADAMTEPEVEAAIKDPIERLIRRAVSAAMAKFSG